MIYSFNSAKVRFIQQSQANLATDSEVIILPEHFSMAQDFFKGHFYF
ncbi:hypothetical protein SSYIS1_12240 [Serratia symbiotica]|uniref:Uncharacterized protein n=1 Tax=Serratia symbiotica TaxID=138074 RepID=A0A455VMB9_9GAMM|nr:hypothetical protein SSYIS1_12240 [Serratia symbiotica]